MAIDVTVRIIRVFLLLLFVHGHITPCKSKLTTGNTDDLRLPQSVLPEHYDLEMQPIITEPDVFIFHGEVNITMQIRNATNNITLHVKDINVNENAIKLISVEGDSSPPVVTGVTKDTKKQFCILQLNKEMHSGYRYQIQLKFMGYLSKDMFGFYRSSYKDQSGKTRWLATTQFEPAGARQAFPCFDEPAMKATFNITLVRPENLTSLSNMPIYNSENRNNGWVADYFMCTVPMSTYLLAFIVSPFKGVGTPEFTIWARDEYLKFTGYALEIGPKLLKYYENFFNITFPLPKIDMVAIPDFPAGGMENWGAITYKELVLLYDKEHSSDAQKQRIAEIVSHELAHQWFGDLVTPKWWNDLWLNEGFARYFQFLGVDAIRPDWDMDQQFVINQLQDVMKLDSLQSSHPISVPVNYPEEITEIFDQISYGKGASILRMIKNVFGDSTFKRGLRNFLNEYQYHNAEQDDLWKHLTAAQEKYEFDVKKVMDYWTLNTGYPVVFIDTDASTGELTIKQYRFLLGNESDKYSSSNWPIPLTYTDSRNLDWSPNTKMWLTTSTDKIASLLGPDVWIVANVQQVGYYKVNYNKHNWQLLIRQLQTDFKKIHVINRAQIIDDSLDLARAGYLNYDFALDTTLYLNKETDFLPWKALVNSFNYMKSMISHEKIYDSLKKYLIKQMRPVYERLGWEEIEGEKLLQQYLRSLSISLMCYLDYNDCVRTAMQKFVKWRINSQKHILISSNIRRIVYCTAIKNSGEEVWNYVWELYKNETIPSEKVNYMDSLACSTNQSLLTRYLNWSLTDGSGIKKQDGVAVFTLVASKHDGRELAYRYLLDKWDIIFNRFRDSAASFGQLIKSTTIALNTQLQLNQLKQLYQKYQEDAATVKMAFDQSIEQVEINCRWMLTKFSHMKTWLERQTLKTDMFPPDKKMFYNPLKLI